MSILRRDTCQSAAICVYVVRAVAVAKRREYKYNEQTGLIRSDSFVKWHETSQKMSSVFKSGAKPCIRCSAARPFQQEWLYMLQGPLWPGEHQHQAQCPAMPEMLGNDIWKAEQSPKIMMSWSCRQTTPMHSHKSMSKATARLSGPWSRNKKLIHANALSLVCEIYFVCYFNVKFKCATCLFPCQDAWLM